MRAQVVPTKEDLKWQAESDARTLKDAAEIRSDPARLKRAIAAASGLYEKALKEARLTQKIANMRKPQSGGKEVTK